MHDFTEAQRSAIHYSGMDACVVAGPGSGKTTVLVERFRQLIQDRHFDVRSILAITFTEKAAANMKAKLLEKFEHNEQLRRELEIAYVSTIHGFCSRLLRENAIAAGIDPRFSVMDARESEELQGACMNAALDDLVSNRRAEALALIEALQTPMIAGELRHAYDGIRSAGKTVEEVRGMPNPSAPVLPSEVAQSLRELMSTLPPYGTLTEAKRKQYDELLEWARKMTEADDAELSELLVLVKNFPSNRTRTAYISEFKEELQGRIKTGFADRYTAHFRTLIFDVLSHFDSLYNQRKAEAGALDFNDLERRAIELLRRDTAVRDKVREQFRQIMLDEFQDINDQQADLIRLIRGEDVFFAVGDVNQSIYGFRHARPEIFHDYRAEVEQGGKHYTSLLHNFRSRAEILSCVEALLNDKAGIERRELVAGTAFAAKDGSSIEVMRAVDLEDREIAVKREARWIAHRILQLRGTLTVANRLADFGDFAILCRNGDSMTPVLEAFDEAKIPYVCGRRQSFLVSREGRDITALLRTIANPRDGVSLGTLLRSPLVGLSDEALLQLRVNGGSLPGGLKQPLTGIAAEDRERIERFNQNLRRWRQSRQLVPLDVLLGRALSACGFRWTPGSLLGGNVESFLHLARSRGNERPLLDFLRELESLEDAASTESDLADADQGNCVQVMTAHAAKGLEFKVTIIAAMNKGTNRGTPAVTFTTEFGLGLKWKDANDQRGVKDSWSDANGGIVKRREEHEMSRLLYVAMTRAEEHLILSYSTGKQKAEAWARWVEDFFGERVVIHDQDPPLLTGDPPDLATAVPVVPRPLIGEQHDTAVNVTSLALFAKCPRKYYIQRYAGWATGRPAKFDPEALPKEDDDGVSAAELGSLVHEVLAGKPGEYPDEALSLARVFQRSDLGQRAEGAEKVSREWDFIADIEGTLVRGSIDLWFGEDGELFLVDYKTDMPPVRPEDYAPQLAIYALALERAFGVRPAKAYLHFLRPDVVAEVPVDLETLDHARRLIAELREAQNDLRFELREGEHCRQCQYYRSLCPAGMGEKRMG